MGKGVREELPPFSDEKTHGMPLETQGEESKSAPQRQSSSSASNASFLSLFKKGKKKANHERDKI